MSTLVYGPDSFTVGADTHLAAYNANWTRDTAIGASKLGLLDADDFLRIDLSTDGGGGDVHYAMYVYEGAGSPTGDQRIVADLRIGNGVANTSAELHLRSTITGNRYICAILGDGTRVIQRFDAAAFLTLATDNIGTTSLTLFSSCEAKAIGTGASVVITFTVLGQADLTYTDTSGSRLTSGNPGIATYEENATASNRSYFDNVSIYDETTAGGGSVDVIRRPLVVGILASQIDDLEQDTIRAALGTFQISGVNFLGSPLYPQTKQWGLGARQTEEDQIDLERQGIAFRKFRPTSLSAAPSAVPLYTLARIFGATTRINDELEDEVQRQGIAFRRTTPKLILNQPSTFPKYPTARLFGLQARQVDDDQSDRDRTQKFFGKTKAVTPITPLVPNVRKKVFWFLRHFR